MLTEAAAHARIIREMNAIEQTIDTLFAQQAALALSVGQAQLDLAIPPAQLQAALLRMNRATERALNLRGEQLRVRAELRRVGETRLDIGDYPCPPPSGVLETVADEALAA